MANNKLLSGSFITRTISGAIVLAFTLITIIMGGDVLFIAIAALSLRGLYEMYRALNMHLKPIGFIGYCAAVAYLVLIRIDKTNYITIYLVLVLLALLAAYVFTFPRYKTEDIMMTFFGLFYVVLTLSYVYIVRQGHNGEYIVWLIFISSWGSDTCAYLFGMLFGQHKMAPVLSPKKTIEGAIGGVIGAAILGAVYATIFHGGIVAENMDARIAYAIICAVGSLISMVGDLAASAIKRNHGIKDYGNLIPGHGGVLDRFDSVMFVAPIIWLMHALF
ncbi:MAG: phosphatidate cytidylyltransferase [Eubacterium sp.]